MEELRTDNEFEVLGYNIKLKEGSSSDDASPCEIVNLVNETVNAIKEKAPQLDNGKIAVLAALQLAGEKLKVENDFKTNLDTLHTTAVDALQLIEEVSPTTI